MIYFKVTCISYTNTMKNIIRPLGPGETWLALLHNQARGTAQISVLASIEGAIDKLLLKNALAYLARRYPQLRSRLVLTETGYLLVNDVEFNTIPIHYFNYQQDDAWQDFMKQEANTALPQEHYLWRVTLLSPANQEHQSGLHHLIITIHHAITDGLSMVALIDSILAYFNNPKTPLQIRAVPQPIEALYSHQFEDSKNINPPLETLDDIKRYQWPHQQSASIEKRETHFKFEFFPATYVAQLHTACLQHQLSINAILNSAMLLAAQKILGQSFNAGLSTPINLRKKTHQQVTEMDMAFLCCVINTVHPNISVKTDFWKLAAEYQQQLNHRLNSMTLPSNDYDFLTLKKNLAFVWDSQRNFFCYDFMVTNLGLLHFPHQSMLYKIKGMRLGTCRQAGDNNMMLLVDSTADGMFCTFGYVSPLITDSWAEEFIAYFKHTIKLNLAN